MLGVRSALSRFAPPLAVMALIFLLSAQTSADPHLPAWEVGLRKLGHMTEYAVLWFLWWRALGYRYLAAAVAITLTYAITDEFHQTFVAGRHGTAHDVGIDAVGVALAIVVSRRAARAPRLRRRPAGTPGR